MKAYTDLEQSKTLSKILPIESADMWYHGHCSPWESEREYDSEACPFHSMSPNWDKPCWSLAALLDVLPPYLFEFERGIDLNIYPNLNGKGWHCSYMPNAIENMKNDKFKLIMSEDNLVDACYEIIIKLKENNLI